MKLRKYQQKYIDNFEVGTSNLVRGECRMGKSLVLEKTIDKYFHNSRVLTISSRVEVLNELSNYFPNHTRLQGSHKYDPSKLITLSTPQTLIRRELDYSQFDCIAVDEIHEVKQMKAVKQIRESYTGTFIGMTATPLDSKGNFIGGFDHILDYTSVPQMIADGYLAPTRFYSAGDITGGLSIKRGEYVEAEVEQALNSSGLYEHIVHLNDTEHHWDTQHKTIIFANSIKAGTRMLEAFNRPDVRILHSNLPKSEYDANMSWFRESPSGIMINVRIMSTGFNECTVDSLILLSPTNVKSLAMQTYFRASTINPDKPDKVAHVYDFGGSLKKHSPFFDDWYKEPKLSCMEQAKLIDDPEQRYFAMLACTPEPVVTVCDGKLPASYVGNPYVINYEVTTPNIKPCGEVMSIHDMKYATTESKSNRGIIYKWTKCKCGFTSKVVLKCMSTPSDLVLVYDEQPSKPTNKVLAIYSKEHNKCLLVIDDPKLVTYKFKFAGTQAEIFNICKDVLKDKPFILSSNIPLPKLPNSHVNKSLGNVVDLINWDDESKNTSMMRKLCKSQLLTLTKQFGYSKHYVYYYMKVVMSSNLKELVKLLESTPSKSAVNRFKLKYEEQMGLNKPKAPEPTTNLSSIDFDVDSDEVPF